jgi:hypothetical protein
MLDGRNLVTITGGIVSDPEVINDSILKFRFGVDYAGSERDSDNTSGYFDVVFYLNNEDSQRTSKFLRGQLADGKFKKGSQVSILGRLVQERWTGQDDKKNSRVTIVAESVNYVKGFNSQNAAGGGTGGATGGTATAEPLPSF